MANAQQSSLPKLSLYGRREILPAKSRGLCAYNLSRVVLPRTILFRDIDRVRALAFRNRLDAAHRVFRMQREPIERV